MKKQLIIVFSLIAVAFLGVHTGAAQSLGNYLQDKSDAVLRVELITPPGVVPQMNTFWGRIRSLLGIRQVTRIKPPVGTELIVQASAYASSPYQTDSTPCITAAGTRVRPGIVATNFLPLGALLEINGQEFIVEDRMNSRYDGYYMDLWFPSTSSALQFGRKSISITITGYGKPGQDIRLVTTETENDETATETEAAKGFWQNVQERLAFIGQLLGARSAADLNKHDIDCLVE